MEPDSALRRASDRQRVFGTVWGVAMLAHLWNQANGWDVAFGFSFEGLAALGLLAAVLFLLQHPGSPARLAAAAALQIAHVAAVSPFVADHWTLAALVNGGILVTAGSLWRETRALEAGAFHERFAPAGRLIFLVCYGAAALSKWNQGFLDPQASCGLKLFSLAASYFPTPSLASIPIFLTLAAETGVTLGLLFRRTRGIAIRVGLFFHFIVSLTPAIGVYDFTASVFALLFLFSPEESTDRLREMFASAQARWPRLLAPGKVALFARGFALFAAAWVVLVVPRVAHSSSRGLALYVGTQAFNAYAVMVIVCAARVLGRDPLTWRPLTRPLPVQAIPVALALLAAASPYLGLRNVGVFTMFSNLRTEQGTNHLFVPKIPLSAQEDDLVQIESSSDPQLAAMASTSLRLNFFELRRKVQAAGPGTAVTFLRDGVRVEHSPAHPFPELLAPIPLLEWKLVLFRPIVIEHPVCGN